MSFFETLTLNGVTYSGEALVRFVDDKLKAEELKEYEKSLYLFIREWISYSNIISVNTSGTTGEPKTISIEKSRAIASAKMTCEYFGLNENTKALLCLSTEFIGGKMMIVRAFVSGMNLITVETNGNPLQEINQRIDFVAMAPLQVQNSLENEETSMKFLDIPDVIIGGASVSPILKIDFQNAAIIYILLLQ